MKLKKNYTTFKEIFTFGLPLIGVRFFAKFISYFDTLMLTAFVGFADIGIYNIILPTSLLFMIIPTSISSLLMPLIVEEHTKKNHTKITNLMRILYTYLTLLTIPIISIFILYGHLFLDFFFGSEFLTGLIAFQILLVGILCNTLTGVNLQYFIGVQKPKRNLYLSTLGVSFNIGLNLVLIPFYGIIGAAIATSISYIAMMLYSLYFVHKDDITLPIKHWLIILFNSSVGIGIMQLCTTFLPWHIYLNFFLGFVIGGSIYWGLCFVTQCLNYTQLHSLFVKKKL